MTKPKWVMVCDESGAKGFSDKPATNNEQIGVVAGLLLTSKAYDALSDVLPTIKSKYQPSDGSKLHIADLDKKKQDAIRDEVFELIKGSGGHIIYEAITQSDAHKSYTLQQKYWDKLKNEGKIRGYGYNFSDHKKRLHEILFHGCFNRAIDYIEAENPTSYTFSLDMLTDTIDEPIIGEIKSSIGRFLTFDLAQKREIKAERYNYKTKSVEKLSGTTEYEVKTPEGVKIIDLSGIDFDIRIDNTCDLIADIISNSVLYYLTAAFEKNESIRLGSQEAIDAHPLSDQFVSLTAEGDLDMAQKLNTFPISEDEINSDSTPQPSNFAKNFTFTKDKE